MYLLERLIGVSIHAIVLALICLILSKSGRKTTTHVIWIYIGCLAVMGYFFVPNAGSDLAKTYDIMHAYANSRFEDLFSSLSDKSAPGATIYYFLVGQLQNDNMLPAISALITFSFVFSIFRSMRKEAGCKAKDIAVIMFMFMSRGLYLQSIANIRTIMALAICAWCVYQEFYRKKKLLGILFFYFLAASLHVMGQLVLLYRLGYLFVESSKNLNRKIQRIILAFVILCVVFSYGRGYVDKLFDKAMNYLGYAEAGTSYFYLWEAILSWGAIFIAIYLMLVLSKTSVVRTYQEETVSSEGNQLIRFMKPLICFNIAMAFVEFSTFMRLSWFITILCIPLGLSTFQETRKCGMYKNLGSELIVISTIMLFIASLRGDLCSLKFFVM